MGHVLLPHVRRASAIGRRNAISARASFRHAKTCSAKRMASTSIDFWFVTKLLAD